jgi:hypothetical protein
MGKSTASTVPLKISRIFNNPESFLNNHKKCRTDTQKEQDHKLNCSPGNSGMII